MIGASSTSRDDHHVDFLEHALARGPLPERPCPVITNASTRGRPLPVVDAFAERRRHIREVGRAADFRAPQPSSTTQKLDSLFLHRIGGPLIFLAVVLLVFQAMFTWATPFMDGEELQLDRSILLPGTHLAAALGPEGIRVNSVSAGPIKTLASAGIGSFKKILDEVVTNAPLRRNVTIEDVGNTGAFLCSDLAAGITGENIYVDSGYNIVSMGVLDKPAED